MWLMSLSTYYFAIYGPWAAAAYSTNRMLCGTEKETIFFRHELVRCRGTHQIDANMAQKWKKRCRLYKYVIRIHRHSQTIVCLSDFVCAQRDRLHGLWKNSASIASRAHTQTDHNVPLGKWEKRFIQNWYTHILVTQAYDWKYFCTIALLNAEQCQTT